MQPPTAVARQEHEIAANLLAKREAQMITALEMKPPPYILGELGERPSEPYKRKDWDRAVRQVEDYRQEHGISDPRSALGPESKDSVEIASRKAAEASLRRAQRDLGLKRELGRSREQGMGIERSLGIGR